jgi:hypothetical protein
VNLGLLTLAGLAIGRASWPAWAMAVAALCVLSAETQIATWLGMPLTLPHLAIAHSAVLGLALVRRDTRARLAARLSAGLRSPSGVGRKASAFLTLRSTLAAQPVAAVALGLLLVVLVARAVLFVPESADPYHLVKAALLADTLSLRHLPVLDSKINVLGYLYELGLADLAMGADGLRLWGGLQGPLLVGIYFAAILLVVHRSGAAVSWYALLLPCLIPAVFHQGILVKNDLFAALLALPALLIVDDERATSRLGRYAAAGFLAGLAASAKATMLPVALALAVCLPWRPLALAGRTRMAAGAGFLAGIVIGGLAYVSLANVATYGTVSGPITSGNLATSVIGAVVSLGRFVVSWFDASLFTRHFWPDRGGWGGAFGPAFIWALVVLTVHSIRNPRARRAMTITLVCLVPFGLLYPDADLAHRLALAPAVFAILAAVEIEAGRGAFRGWSASAVVAALCVAVSGAMIARSSAAYLRQAEYARSPALARALEPSPGYLDGHPVWQMRQINAQLGPERTCLIGPENALVLAGHQWDAAVVVQPDRGGFSNVWRPDTLLACRSLLLLPNDFREPDAISAQALARCGIPRAAGPSVPVSFVRCGG